MELVPDNPRVGSSILFFGITVSNTYFAFSNGFLKEEVQRLLKQICILVK